MESMIAQHALDMQRRFYSLSGLDVRRIAFDIAEHEGISHPFNKTTKLAGYHWLNGFLALNGMLSVREPEATSICRAVGFKKVQVQKFFWIWNVLLEEIGEIDGPCVWNMDENGLTVVHKPCRIIAKKGQKQVGKITSGERGTCKKSNKRTLHKGKRATDKQPTCRPNAGYNLIDVNYMCIYCSEPYSDPPTEDWLQCPACNHWFHENCGNEQSGFDLCLQE